MTATTDRLPFTGDDEADRLLVASPLALLIGFALDQQVPSRRHSAGRPSCSAASALVQQVAATDPAKLDAVFRERPALHRFPGSMAGKVQQLAAAIARDYDNDASRIWTQAVQWLPISSGDCSVCPASAR